MKIFIIAYAVVTALLILYIGLIIIKVASEFKRNNPTCFFKKVPFVERAIAYIRAGVLIFCPILNIVVFFILLANYEDVEDTMYEAIADRAEY